MEVRNEPAGAPGEPVTDPGVPPLDGERRTTGSTRGADGGAGPARRGLGLRLAAALACGVLGFVMVAQVRTTESLGDRLQGEREEDLARILSELSAQSDRLQSDITELRLTLLEFETSAEGEDLALRSLQRRFDDLQILVGTVAAEGPGVVLTVEDPRGLVTQDLLVDAIQELRDAGAEAIALDDIRLVASSAFTTRNRRILLDRKPIEAPYRIVAIGPPDTIAKALAIPGGAIDTLQVMPGVSAEVQTRTELTVPPVSEPPTFVFGTPIVEE